MRNLVITFFTVGIFASSAAAQNSQPATDSAAATATTTATTAPDKIVCHDVETTGSRFTTRVCEKQSDMDKKAADSQRFISGGVNAQLNSGTTP